MRSINNKSTREYKGNSRLEILSDYVVLDFETTGKDPTWDEIIEVAAVRIRNNQEVDCFTSLVKPNAVIDNFISDLTGITNEMVASASHIKEILPKLIQFIGNDIVVGHNIVSFDANFMYDKCQEHLNYNFSNDLVDTLRLSRLLFPSEAHHRLEDLVKLFGVENKDAHRALADTRATNECYQYMIKYMTDNGINLNNFGNRKYSKKLSAKDITTDKTEFDESSGFYKKIFVFTGTLSRMPRKEALQYVKDFGGECGDDITKKPIILS